MIDTEMAETQCIRNPLERQKKQKLMTTHHHQSILTAVFQLNLSQPLQFDILSLLAVLQLSVPMALLFFYGTETSNIQASKEAKTLTH